MAPSETEFRRTIKVALSEVGFDLLELDNPEPLAVRLLNYSASDELLELARR